MIYAVAVRALRIGFLLIRVLYAVLEGEGWLLRKCFIFVV